MTRPSRPTPIPLPPTWDKVRGNCAALHRLHAPFTLLLLLTLVCGCSERQKRQWRPHSATKTYGAALDAENADQRRDGVARIAESNYYQSDDAFAVLDTVARTDPQPQIRCIAIRTLGRYEDDRPVKPLLTILQADPRPTETVPADDDVRLETLIALAKLTKGGHVSDAQRVLVRDLLIRVADMEETREVRLAALGGLAEFKDPQVFAPLIRALRTDDFGIADRAEQSLIALTGETHYYDPDAWSAWVAATQQPFANAGRKPVVTQPAGSSWWEQQKRAWRRGLKLGVN